MILISHRGNLNGSLEWEENKPHYINNALDLGYDVEIDVWKQPDGWYLGHDEPEFLIDEEFLINKSLWCHAKNLESLDALLGLGVKCFWHENDKYTLTSNNFIWTYPGYPLGKKSICVMPKRFAKQFVDLSNCAGICSDYIAEWNK